MCQGIARCFLIFCNIIFLLFGVACLVVGIWVRVDKNNMISLFRISENADVKAYDLPSLLESGAYILIAVGAVVFVISIFGFCGAIRKSKCCLITYGVLVGIVLVIQVAAAIAAGVFQSQFDSHAKKFLTETMPQVYRGPYDTSNVVSLALDAMQASQSCCGINGSSDFETKYPNFNKTWKGVTYKATIPFTCCMSDNKDSYPADKDKYISGLKDQNCPETKSNSHEEGCYDKLRELVQMYFKVVLGVAIGVAVLELILIIVACCITTKNKDEIV